MKHDADPDSNEQEDNEESSHEAPVRGHYFDYAHPKSQGDELDDAIKYNIEDELLEVTIEGYKIGKEEAQISIENLLRTLLKKGVPKKTIDEALTESHIPIDIEKLEKDDDETTQ